MASRGTRSHQPAAGSMDSSPAVSDPGHSARGRSVDPNASVSPVLGACAKGGRSRNGRPRESPEAVRDASATASQDGALSLTTADASPAGSDEFEMMSRGRGKNDKRRKLVAITEEEGHGCSSNSLPKRRAAQSTINTTAKDGLPHTLTPAVLGPASVTDQLTQDVYGMAASPQMQFKVR